MALEPDTPSPDPVPPSPPAESRFSDSTADRLVTIAAWAVGLGLIMALAGLVAFGVHLLQRQDSRLEVREREYTSPPGVLIAPPPPPDDPRPEPAAPVAGRDGVVITNPSWINPPRPEFPSEAVRAGVEDGFVQLDCLAAADGRIRSCDIVKETPAGAGFARAAIEAARAARLQPRTVNGEATEGRVRFSTRFNLK